MDNNGMVSVTLTTRRRVEHAKRYPTIVITTRRRHDNDMVSISSTRCTRRDSGFDTS